MLHAPVELYALRVRCIAVELERAGHRRPEVARLAPQRHRATFRLRDVHEGVEHHQDTVGLLDTVGERLPVTLEVRLRPEGQFRRPPQPRQRRAEVVRHIVECAAHTAHQPLDAVEHGVEQLRQLVDRIVFRRHRHALVGATGSDDAAHSARQAPDRLHSRLCRDPSAGEGDDDDGERHQAERRPEAREDVAARLGALPHLHDRAVTQRRRADLERRRVPAFGVAQQHRLGAAIEHAHEDAFARRALLHLHRVRHGAKTAVRIDGGVFAKLGVDDLVVPLRQR